MASCAPHRTVCGIGIRQRNHLVSRTLASSRLSTSTACRSSPLVVHPLLFGSASRQLSSTSYNHDNANNFQSGRSAFAQIPVHPSLLDYIQKIGVGIPKRNPKKRRMKKKRRQLPNYIEEEDGEHQYFWLLTSAVIFNWTSLDDEDDVKS